MNKERFNIWLKALKSGKYTRGKHRLRVSNALSGRVSYCCLGVVCDLASKDLGISWDGDEFDGASIALPTSVASWLELKIAMGTGSGEKYFYVLDENEKDNDIWNVNDYSKVEDFGEVIAALERTFPDLVEQDDTSVQG